MIVPAPARSVVLPELASQDTIARDPVSPPTRTLLLAAAILGAVELSLFRVVSPVLAHVPGETLVGDVAEALQQGGFRAFHATALLVALAAAAYIVTAGRRRDVAPYVVAAVLVTTMLAAATEAPALRLVAHGTFMGAVAALVAVALAGRAHVYLLSISAAAIAMLAGRLPLLFDAAAASQGVEGPTLNVGVTASVAEAAFVLVPLLLAVDLVRRRPPPPAAWVAGFIVALATAAALAASPSYSAISSTWAAGVTLSLPLPLYIMAAAAAALVLVTWLLEPGSRLLAAALVLFAVAGAQPAIVHHNLTAILALVVLATSRRAGSSEPAFDDARSSTHGTRTGLRRSGLEGTGDA